MGEESEDRENEVWKDETCYESGNMKYENCFKKTGLPRTYSNEPFPSEREGVTRDG
jgi:hypothetical protein